MVLVKNRVLKDEICCNGTLIFSYAIHYPEFSLECSPSHTKKINHYYEVKAKVLLDYCLKVIYPQAVDQYHQNIQRGYPVMEYQVLSDYTITFNQNCILSLYQDRYLFTGGAHGNTKRTSTTWDLSGGHMILLKDLFPPHYDWEDWVISSVIETITHENERQKNTALGSIYFDTYETDVPKTFQAENFYLTEGGFTVFFQQYDIAPYSSGIRTFSFPFESRAAAL